MTAPRPKSTILEIEPYRPGRAMAPGFEHPIKLSANENALGCSPRARAAYLAASTALHLYPDPRASALRAALARKHGLDPDRIVFGTGSDEIFSMACQAYLRPGDVMVQPQFAFAAWAIAARAAGAEVRSAAERDHTVDVDAMLAAVDARTRVIFIANPANPTGTVLPHSEIVRLHEGLPRDVLLVIDGAYAEFGGGEVTFAAFSAAPNVLITRTFSKLYGLASLRIGWGYAPVAIADTLNRIRLPFNTPAPAQAAALAALEDEAFTASSVAHVVRGRTQLERDLRDLGLTPIPSATNFVTARFPPTAALTAEQTLDRLAQRGILARGLAGYGMPDCLRITIGAEPEMGKLGTALQSLLAA
ncbi:MAG: histidinol-phosphate transaminase [Vitreimonas sp.]